MAAAFVAPAAIVILLVVVVPLARAAWMSLFDISLVRPGDEPFVGLGNYLDQLTSPGFWAAVGRALVFTVVSTGIELALGLGLALLMDQPLRGRWILRTIVILPWALPTIVNALMWRWIDNAEYGALNALLVQLGMLQKYQVWLSDSDRAMWMVVLADVWKMTPLVAILLLAALQSVDRELIDVARVDGASLVAGVPAHPPAADHPGDPDRPRAAHDGGVQGLRPHLDHDRGRACERHPDDCHLCLSDCVPGLRLRARRGARLPDRADHHGPRGDLPPAPRPDGEGADHVAGLRPGPARRRAGPGPGSCMSR